MPHLHLHYRETVDVERIAKALPGICAGPLGDSTSEYSEAQIVVLPMPISSFAQNARTVMLDIFRTSRVRAPGVTLRSGRIIADGLKKLLPGLPDGSISVWIVGEKDSFNLR